MLETILAKVEQLSAQVNAGDVNWFRLIILFLLSGSFFHLYIDWRQYKFLQTATIPSEVADIVDKETFAKSRAYNRAKLKFSLVSTIFSAILDLWVYALDVYPLFWFLADMLVKSRNYTYFRGEVATNIVFFYLFNLVRSIITLPLDWYSTFVIEENFGFNKQTHLLFFKDFAKSQVLAAVLNSVFVGGIVVIVDWAGTAFFIYLTLFFVAMILVFMVLSPTVIQPLFNKYTPMEEGELRSSVNDLAQRLKFPLTRIYVEDGSTRSSHSNAYFIGLPWYKQIVVFDTLIAQCTTEQITAVLGHELGHWKLNHIAKNVLISTSLVLISMTTFAIFINNFALYASVGFVYAQPLMGRMLIFFELLAPFFHILQFFISATTRKFEYEADEFAVSLGYGPELKTALITMHKTNLSTVAADKLYSTYHYTHPILPERLKALNVQIEKYESKDRKDR